jgi:hypothetical protein
MHYKDATMILQMSFKKYKTFTFVMNGCDFPQNSPPTQL